MDIAGIGAQVGSVVDLDDLNEPVGAASGHSRSPSPLAAPLVALAAACDPRPSPSCARAMHDAESTGRSSLLWA